MPDLPIPADHVGDVQAVNLLRQFGANQLGDGWQHVDGRQWRVADCRGKE